MKNSLVCIALGLLLSLAVRSAEQSERPFTMAYRYNLQGQVTGTIAPDPDGSGPLKYLATRNTYERGLVVKVESGELQSWVNEDVAPSNWKQAAGFTPFTITEYSYDQYGRKSVVSLKRGDTGETESVAQFNYDSASRVQCEATRMNRDAFGSLPDACTQGAQGIHGPDRIKRYTYDTLDQVLTVQNGVGTDLVQTYVKNEYGGRLLLSQTDANGNRTELRYDEQKRLARRVYPSRFSTSFLNERDYEEYTYEPTGNLKTERKRNGEIITYTYDAANRVRIQDLSDNTHSPDVYFDYYPHGARRYARFGSISGPGVQDDVDAFGRLKSTLVNTSQAASSSGPSRRVSYDYDDNGNRVSVTHPDGQRFGYAFDGLNRNCGVADSVAAPSCGSSALMVAVNYRNDGGRKALVRGGITTSYMPDPVGRLLRFTQDLPGSTNDLTNEFAYSVSNQITRLTQSNIAYSYSGNVNRTGTYARNGLNQVTAVAGLPVLHDAGGNLTADPGLNFTMTYDMENRIVSTNGAASVTASFKYDPAGRLLRLTVGLSTSDFLYDGNALVAEYENGVLTRRYVHGDQADEPWVEYTGSGVGASNRRYLLSDHQGSIIARTDSGGGDLRQFAYDSFGIPRATNEGRFGYTGQIWLRELGLFYYKARVYSPALGRFLQADPVGYADNYNLYAYVGNDPVNASDPSGMNTVPDREEPRPSQTDLPYLISCDFVASLVTGEIVPTTPSFFNDSRIGQALAGQLNFVGLVNGGSNPVTGNYLTPLELQNSVGELALNVAFFGSGTVPRAVAKSVATVDQYALKAVEAGFRPVMQRGFREPQAGIWMESGEVWKFGTTKNPMTRYSQKFLNEWSLRYQREIAGSLREALAAEKKQILDYLNQTRTLPPGNKIVR